MTLDTYTEPATDQDAVEHLEVALEQRDPGLKNYHIRQALQLLIAESESR